MGFADGGDEYGRVHNEDDNVGYQDQLKDRRWETLDFPMSWQSLRLRWRGPASCDDHRVMGVNLWQYYGTWNPLESTSRRG